MLELLRVRFAINQKGISMKILSSLRWAAAVLFAVCAWQATAAPIVKLTLTDTGNNVIDSFTLDLAAGRSDGAGTPPFLLFDITDDLLGYNGVFFGDGSTSGWMGIGPIVGGDIVAQVISEFFSPALYSGSGFFSNLTPGSSYTADSGDVLTVTAVPEPVSLALLGIGLVGFGIRRRRSAA